MESSLSEFCERIGQQARQGNLDSALVQIVDFVAQIILHQTTVGRVFSSPELDNLCGLIGELTRNESGPAAVAAGEAGENHIVYLVTELAKTGGHTRVLTDIISAEHADRHTILISGIYDRTVLDDLSGLFGHLPVMILMAPAGSYLSRLQWMQRELAQIRPRRTYILPHHFDAVTMAAAQPDLVGKLVYIHNCDHALALGVHLPHARHVDLHAKGFYQCREQEGVAANVVWPLVAADRGHRLERPFLARGHVTTCTSGGFEKFEFRHGIEQVPYLYRYEDIVPLIVEASGGTHIHIGELSDVLLEKIRAGLAAAGIASDRFAYVPYVPSLWNALLDHDVDVYIGSFPVGGGLAVIEAMGAGLPVIIHSNYRSSFHSSETHVHDQAMLWRDPLELTGWLSKFNPSELAVQARLSRAFYEAHHRPELLRAAIELDEAGREPPAPLRPAYIGNRLQAFLDDRHATWTASRREVIVTDQEMAARLNDVREKVREAMAAEAQKVLAHELRLKDEAWRLEAERQRRAAAKETAEEAQKVLAHELRLKDEAWRREAEHQRRAAVEEMAGQAQNALVHELHLKDEAWRREAERQRHAAAEETRLALEHESQAREARWRLEVDRVRHVTAEEIRAVLEEKAQAREAHWRLEVERAGEVAARQTRIALAQESQKRETEWRAEVERVREATAVETRSRLDEEWRTEADAMRATAVEETRAVLEEEWRRREDRWRAEVERVRADTIRQMTIPARGKRLLRRVVNAVLSRSARA